MADFKEYRIEEWTNKTILFITGLAGSGKTTLAKKIKEGDRSVYIFQLDGFQHLFTMTKEQAVEKARTLGDRELSTLLVEFLKSLATSEFSKEANISLFEHASEKAFEFTKKCEGKLGNRKYIFEGSQIYFAFDSEYLDDKSLILMNAGLIKCELRLRKRAKELGAKADSLKFLGYKLHHRGIYKNFRKNF